jgi:hypothetical protein
MQNKKKFVKSLDLNRAKHQAPRFRRPAADGVSKRARRGNLAPEALIGGALSQSDMVAAGRPGCLGQIEEKEEQASGKKREKGHVSSSTQRL